MKRKKTENTLLSIGIGLGIAYWTIESAVDAYLFGEGTFLERLLTPDPNEAWMRCVIFVILAFFGAFGQGAIARRKEMEERLKELNLSLTQRTEVLAGMNKRLEDEMTHTRETAKALAVSQASFSSIVEKNTDGILIVERDGRICFANPAARSLLNRNKEDLIGTLFGTPLVAGELIEVDIVRLTGTPGTAEMRVVPSDWEGQSVWRVSLHDITEQKLAEEKIQVMVRELRRSNSELQQFTSIASHDLQEPLRKVAAYGDILEEEYGEVLGEEGRAYLKRMQKASSRMQQLIDSLLSLSRISTKAQPFETVNLEQVLHEVIQDLEVASADSMGAIQVDPLPPIDADPIQMQQLFQNLIGNSLKYHKKDVPPVVKIKYRAGANGDCRITIEDNGIGFDEQYRDRIFQPFQRLHGKDEFSGSGMGLAICEKIVKRHHGTIRAKSLKGKESTFIVRLPFHQTAES